MSNICAIIHTVALISICVGCGAPETRTLNVCVASSTGPAVTDLARLFEARTGIRVTVNQASSSTLARQIASGAPCDLFLSANLQWMGYLSNTHKSSMETVTLLKNRLVIIASTGYTGITNRNPNIVTCLGTGRLAVGDPSHVPAGIYAKQSLETLGIYQSIKDRIIPAANVKAAQRLVECNEVPSGIVYGSDAQSMSNARVLKQLPETSHDPIIYPLALLSRDSTIARSFFKFLQSDEALATFRGYGFLSPIQTTTADRL